MKKVQVMLSLLAWATLTTKAQEPECLPAEHFVRATIGTTGAVICTTVGYFCYQSAHDARQRAHQLELEMKRKHSSATEGELHREYARAKIYMGMGAVVGFLGLDLARRMPSHL